VCKKLIKNFQPFGKKFQKTVGGIFLSYTVHCCMLWWRAGRWAQLGTSALRSSSGTQHGGHSPLQQHSWRGRRSRGWYSDSSDPCWSYGLLHDLRSAAIHAVHSVCAADRERFSLVLATAADGDVCVQHWATVPPWWPDQDATGRRCAQLQAGCRVRRCVCIYRPFHTSWSDVMNCRDCFAELLSACCRQLMMMSG